ncbi:MAG: SCO1 protein [Phycisphaerales bacterium]|nr:MAG: SCO1 protein [Phycisphaerales bacterium]
MSQRVLVVLIAVVASVLLGLVGLLVALGGGPIDEPRPDPLKPDPMLEGYAIPPFELVDQDGQPVDQTILEGQVTILAFIFTNCPFACPGMTGQMLRLQDALQGTGVRFLSISVDPANDTPPVLREYAQRNGMDTTRWRLLTGPFEQVRTIVRDSLNFHVGQDPSRQITMPDGRVMDNISHPSHLILVGPNREVLGIYLYYEPERMAELERRAKAAWRAVEERR